VHTFVTDCVLFHATRYWYQDCHFKVTVEYSQICNTTANLVPGVSHVKKYNWLVRNMTDWRLEVDLKKQYVWQLVTIWLAAAAAAAAAAFSPIFFSEISGIRTPEWLPFSVVSKYPKCIVWFCHKARVWQTDRRTEGQNCDTQDRASVGAHSCHNKVIRLILSQRLKLKWGWKGGHFQNGARAPCLH